MFKSKLLLLTVIASITLVSCKKESLVTSVTPSSADALVKTKSEGNITETYYYDSQKRVSKIVFTPAVGNSYYYEYTYTNNEVLEFHSNETIHELEETMPNGTIRIYCSANPRSLALGSDGYFKGNAAGCETNSFSYDADGFVVEQTFAVTDFNKSDAIRNDKRNITRISSNGFSYVGGDFTTIVNFEYYTDKVSSIGNKNFGKSFLGKSSENLVKTESENNLKTDYTYTFDSQKRVSTKTQTKNNTQVVTAYTYY